MQSAETVLGVLRERGMRGLPLNELYRQLFNPELYFLAYGNIYSNKGAMTPGPDGETADGMSRGKIGRIIDAMRHERYRFQPVRRVYIPKKNGKLKPLGMPPWSDKLVGEAIRLLLEAYYEPQFSGRSHGFRRGRGCHSALSEVSETWTGTAWFIESDISDCFGSFDHEVMLSILAEKIHDNRFLRLIKQMLQAGYLEDWEYHDTLSGVPQGGVVSPVLSNIYLHRMDEFVETVLMPEYTRGKRRASNPAYFRVRSAARRARARGDHAKARKLRAQQRSLPSSDPDDPGYRRLRYVRYADFAACCHSRQQAGQVKARLAGWLAQRGLSLNEDKTRIVCLTRGFDFLGWNIRRYPNGKLLIKPSKAAIGRHRQRLAEEMRTMRGSNALAVIVTLNPVIRGWTAYHRSQVSSEAFTSLAAYMWTLTWKWARHSHPSKGQRWVAARYFGKFHPNREDGWVFGDKDTGTRLVKHSWTAIRRHVMVKGTASPDDPGLAGYWRYRRDKHGPPLDAHTLALLARQGRNCPLCGDQLLDTSHLPGSPEQWQDWWTSVTRQDIQLAPGGLGNTGRDGERNARLSKALMHASCNRARKARQRRSTAPLPQPAMS
jgi:group II intron reverse transcriptase/maturase